MNVKDLEYENLEPRNCGMSRRDGERLLTQSSLGKNIMRNFMKQTNNGIEKS